MKYVVILGDGMADEPIAELGGKTPLEQARTETLDQLAGRGILGLTRTIPRGLPPGCAVGSLSVLGYDPTRYYTGRSAIEAVGLGIGLRPEDVAFACNLVTLETPAGGVEIMRDSTGGRPPTAEGREIALDLNRGLGRPGLEILPGLSYRHLLVWRNGDTRMRTSSPHDVIGKPIAGSLPEGPGSEVLCDLMERSRAELAVHPICQARLARGERAPTAIWLWGQGKLPVLPPLGQRFELEGAVVSDVPLAAGLGMLAGLASVGVLDDDLRAAAENTLLALEARDFVLVHVDGAAEAGCAGDVQRKVEAIERFDADLVAPLMEGLRQRGVEWRVLIAPDHPTPCALRTHTAEPVPFLVAASSDETKAQAAKRGYNERDARENGIFIPEAHTLVERLLRR